MSAVILVLDAEPVDRQVVTRILGRAGFTVLAAGDVTEALELARSSAPDLLLTNVYLPGSTGRKAAQALRAVCPKLRALLVAGLPDEETVTAAMSDAGVDFFRKSFTADQLTARVREGLDTPA